MQPLVFQVLDKPLPGGVRPYGNEAMMFGYPQLHVLYLQDVAGGYPWLRGERDMEQFFQYSGGKSPQVIHAYGIRYSGNKYLHDRWSMNRQVNAQVLCKKSSTKNVLLLLYVPGAASLFRC